MALSRSEQRELANLALSGNQDAARRIYEYCQRGIKSALFSFRFGDDQEDVEQDCFLQLFRSLHKWDGDADLRTWCYRIAVNIALMRKRKRTLDVVASIDEPVTLDSGEEVTIEPECEDKFLATITDFNDLYNAIDKIAPSYAKTIKLKLEGLEVLDIAARLHTSEGAVKSNTVKGIRQLKSILERKMSTPVLTHELAEAPADFNGFNTPTAHLCHCGRPSGHRGAHKGVKRGPRKPPTNIVKDRVPQIMPTATVQTGNSLTLKLQSGAKLNITLDGNWFYLTENDRRVVYGILDRAKQLGA